MVENLGNTNNNFFSLAPFLCIEYERGKLILRQKVGPCCVKLPPSSNKKNLLKNLVEPKVETKSRQAEKGIKTDRTGANPKSGNDGKYQDIGHNDYGRFLKDKVEYMKDIKKHMNYIDGPLLSKDGRKIKRFCVYADEFKNPAPGSDTEKIKSICNIHKVGCVEGGGLKTDQKSFSDCLSGTARTCSQECTTELSTSTIFSSHERLRNPLEDFASQQNNINHFALPSSLDKMSSKESSCKTSKSDAVGSELNSQANNATSNAACSFNKIVCDSVETISKFNKIFSGSKSHRTYEDMIGSELQKLNSKPVAEVSSSFITKRVFGAEKFSNNELEVRSMSGVEKNGDYIKKKKKKVEKNETEKGEAKKNEQEKFKPVKHIKENFGSKIIVPEKLGSDSSEATLITGSDSQPLIETENKKEKIDEKKKEMNILKSVFYERFRRTKKDKILKKASMLNEILKMRRRIKNDNKLKRKSKNEK